MIQEFYAKLSEQERKVFYVAMLFVVLALFDLLFMRPITSKIKSLELDIKDRQQNIRRDLRLLSYKDRILLEDEAFSAFKTGESQAEEQIIAEFLKTIETIVSESQVILVKLNPGDVARKKGYIEYFANLECEGKLEDMVTFMHKIDSTEQLLKIVKLNMAPKKVGEEGLAATMQVSKLIIDPKSIGDGSMSSAQLKEEVDRIRAEAGGRSSAGDRALGGGKDGKSSEGKEGAGSAGQGAAGGGKGESGGGSYGGKNEEGGGAGTGSGEGSGAGSAGQGGSGSQGAGQSGAGAGGGGQGSQGSGGSGSGSGGESDPVMVGKSGAGESSGEGGQSGDGGSGGGGSGAGGSNAGAGGGAGSGGGAGGGAKGGSGGGGGGTAGSASGGGSSGGGGSGGSGGASVAGTGGKGEKASSDGKTAADLKQDKKMEDLNKGERIQVDDLGTLWLKFIGKLPQESAAPAPVESEVPDQPVSYGYGDEGEEEEGPNLWERMMQKK